MKDSAVPAEEPRARCFAPVVDHTVRILILGSLPGQASLRAGQYYAHPQNQFWRLMRAVLDEDLQGQPYEERLATLLRHHIGLWDSIAEAVRPGSLDSSIADPTENDLLSLIHGLPALQIIAFNGQKSAHIAGRALRACAGDLPELHVLPSSSPAHTLAFAEKERTWVQTLRPALSARCTCATEIAGITH